jgi:hypothetical protein
VSVPIEKNEVNIERLFDWGKEFTLPGDGDKETKVYVRILGDADLNKSRVYALRCSAELRRKLLTEDSDERLAFISPIDDLNKDKVVDIVAGLTMQDIAKTAYKEVVIPLPVEPKEDSTTEQQEKYQTEVDNFPKKRETEIYKFINKKLEAKKKELSKLTDEQLSKEYVSTLVVWLCEREVQTKFKEVSTFYSLYKDSKYKVHLYNTIDEFMNLPPTLKNTLISFYTSMEMDTDTLKKLLEVTQ